MTKMNNFFFFNNYVYYANLFELTANFAKLWCYLFLVMVMYIEILKYILKNI